jgi:hypothetical protein
MHHLTNTRHYPYLITIKKENCKLKVQENEIAEIIQHGNITSTDFILI